MRAPDGFSFTSATAADSNTFPLDGGAYCMDIVASWGGGSITLKRLGPDGLTYLTAATALSADGTSGSIALPKGTYKFVVATAAGIWASISRIPGE